MRPALLTYLHQHGISLPLPGYKALYILMIASALALATALAVRRGLPALRFYTAAVLIAAAAFVGGRVFFELRNARRVSHSLLAVLTGSDTESVGVYLAGICCCVIVLNLLRLDVLAALDVFAPVVALSLAIGRLGCLMSGCCYGKTSSLPWAISFPRGSPAYNAQLTAGLITADAGTSLPVHPTQLYEALFGLTLFAVLMSRSGRRLPRGLSLFVYFAAYSLFRFSAEFLRGDDRGLLLGFSFPQVFSVGLLILGIGGAARVARAARGVRALRFEEPPRSGIAIGGVLEEAQK